MATATSVAQGEKTADGFVVVEEEQCTEDDMTTSLNELDPVDARPPGEPVEALPAGEVQSAQPESHGTKRRWDWDKYHSDGGSYWPKRTSKNKPDGVDEETWEAGVSETEIPGWTQLWFMYAPVESWKRCESWVHATATVDDIKKEVSPFVAFRPSQFYCVGVNTQWRLPFTEELASSSWQNPDPLEHRVIVLTSFRFFPL